MYENPNPLNDYMDLSNLPMARRTCGVEIAVANLVFVDSPASVGYSYSNTSSDYSYFSDDLTGKGS